MWVLRYVIIISTINIHSKLSERFCITYSGRKVRKASSVDFHYFDPISIDGFWTEKKLTTSLYHWKKIRLIWLSISEDIGFYFWEATSGTSCICWIVLLLKTKNTSFWRSSSLDRIDRMLYFRQKIFDNIFIWNKKIFLCSINWNKAKDTPQDPPIIEDPFQKNNAKDKSEEPPLKNRVFSIPSTAYWFFKGMCTLMFKLTMNIILLLFM
jgi:hypothetical protein